MKRRSPCLGSSPRTMRRTAVTIVVASLAVSACSGSSVGTTATTKSIANGYDEGFIYGGSLLCSALEAETGDPSVLVGSGTDELQVLVDGINGYVFRMVTDASPAPDTATNYISGMWDGATIACPEWFLDPTIAGRPGGGDGQPVQ